VYNCFVDFQEVFDSTDQSVTWAVLESYAVESRLIALLKDVNKNAKFVIRVDKETVEWFHTSRDTRQGCAASPYVFTHLERAVDKVSTEEQGVSGISE